MKINYDNQEIDESDMQTLDSLLPKSSGDRRTLADVIFAKLQEGETANNVAVIQKSQRGTTCHRTSTGICSEVGQIRIDLILPTGLTPR